MGGKQLVTRSTPSSEDGGRWASTAASETELTKEEQTIPILADFEVINGDDPITIGNGNIVWETHFATIRRNADRDAFLVFNVKGLTHATEPVSVHVNDEEVGHIFPYALPNGTPNANHRNHWFTQIIVFPGSRLKSESGKKNKLEIHAVHFPGNTGGNEYDDFALKDVICFFHQSA